VEIDLREVRGLRDWYGKQPGRMRVASAQMLNHFAFGTRTGAIRQIDKTMTVRNPRFVSSRIRVTKASTGAPIDRQKSITGSVATQRFSGWTEQEYGTPTDRKRFATKAGRAGDMNKKIRPSARLKPGNEVITMDSPGYRPVGNAGRNVGGFLAMLMRKKENRLVRIKGMLFKRKRKQMELVQVLRKKQPKQIHWLRDARAGYFRGTDIDKLWAKTATALMGKPGKSHR
jgi:hypothetical protein